MALNDENGFSEEEIKRAREYVELREKAKSSLLDYKEIMDQLGKVKASQRHYNKELKRYAKESTELAQERLRIENRLSAAQNTQNANEIRAQEKELKKLEDKENQLRANQQIAEQEVRRTEKLGRVLSDNLNTQNFMGAAYGSALKTLGSMSKELLNQKGYLLEQQKALKMSELQMGLLSKDSEGFRKNVYNAALSTNQLGVDAKALSDMQATYSEEIGRAVILTEAGNQAMAELAMGTTLGKENAAQFAANMEQFGYSVESSRDFMQETLGIAHEMGLNSAETTENVKLALKTAQTYNFGEGVKGVAKMAMLATRLKIEIGAVEKIAEKAFNPEGAIEMAAQLSVLGGEWARIGDPFSLMFKSRTDLAGLTEDIAKAASSGAQFNEVTGEFEIASMELHRLRQVADATGLTMTELTNAARNAAKFSKIKSEISGDFDDDIMEFISSKGRFDSKSGEFKIYIDGKDRFVKDLDTFTNDQLKNIVKEQKTLKERAIQAKTFDEMYENVINQFKSTLLPGFDAFSKAVLEGLTDFSEWIQKDDVLNKIQEFGKQVGEIAGAFVKFATNNPMYTMIGLLVGKTASWVMRGRWLGIGFNSVAGKGGMFGNMFGRRGGGPQGPRTRGNMVQSKKGTWWNQNSPQGRAIMAGNGTRPASWLARNGGRMGGVGALAGLGLGVGAQMAGGKETGLGRGLGMAGSTLGMAGTGAMLGSMFGPVGTVVGGIAGAGFGAYQGYKENYDTYDDFIARPGEKPIGFSSADTLIGMKAGGGIDNFMKKSEKSSSSSGKVTVDFSKPLKVEGKLNLTSNGQNTAIDINNPMLIRELSRLVQEEITISLNGKRNPNPA
jgi:hypothetical protein